SYRLGADSDTGGRAQGVHTLEARIASGEKYPMVSAVGRAQVNKLIEIVSNTGFSQDSVGYQTAADAADCKTVRPCVAEDVIGSFRTATSRHELELDRWLAGNMLLQEWHDSSRHGVRSIAGLSGLQQRYGFSLVKRSLGERQYR